ncbi:hypothetical protein ABZ705_06515 [Streptomyces sp. NPDC006984]|uniref:hypothetical protein n=1 Tax=Streptomyces sp. NPDC006984 TaxID=3155463 RepID=UPI0033F41EEA
MRSVEFEGKKWVPADGGDQCDGLEVQLIQQAMRAANAAWEECRVQWGKVREECERSGIPRVEGESLEEAMRQAGFGGTEVEDRILECRALALRHRRQASRWSFVARWLIDQFWTEVEAPESDRLLLGKFQVEGQGVK